MSNETEVRQTPLGPIDRTGRGFQIICFRDKYNVLCQLQQSSMIDFEVEGGYEKPGSSCIWLGTVDVSDDGERGLPRMHLDRETVRKLIPVLEQWLLTGSFDDSKTEDKTV